MSRLIALAVACILLTLVSAAPPAASKYVPETFSSMAETSHRIIAGKITKLDEKIFTLEIETVHAGELREGETTMEVFRFQDWTCAARWTEYAVGQRVVVFVNRAKGQWRLRSAGGEGEMPIVQEKNEKGELEDRILVRGRETQSLGKAARHAVHGTTLYAVKVTPTELQKAIDKLRQPRPEGGR